MATFNATEARTKLYNLIDETTKTHKPIIITGKRGNAVLLSEEDWNSINEMLFLLSVTGMRESIREGMDSSLRNVMKVLIGNVENLLHQTSSEGCKKNSSAGLKSKAQELIAIIHKNPFQSQAKKYISDLAPM